MKKSIKTILKVIPLLRDFFNIRSLGTNINLYTFIIKKYFNTNKKIYFPVHKNSEVNGDILVGVNNDILKRPGCYIQGIGGVIIGDYVSFASNIGIISANHDFYNLRNHSKKSLVKIGDYSWVGMNSVILPGVELGVRTIVAAGSVVTKSFKEGYCVIGGNPAKLIKKLDKDKFVDFKDKYEYHGFISKKKFESYKRKYLKRFIDES